MGFMHFTKARIGKIVYFIFLYQLKYYMKSVKIELILKGFGSKSIKKNVYIYIILNSKTRQFFELLENTQQLMERNKL